MGSSSFLDAVQERVVVYDGAFGTYVQGCDLSADDFGGPTLEGCNEVLVVTRPDVIAGMHDAFFDVGVDVIETATFGAFAPVLAEYQITDRAHELNLKAARIAREVAGGYPGTWVAGSMGPGTKLPSLGQIRFASLRDAYEVQARGLLEGGVDLLLVETVYDLLQAKAAVVACRRAMAYVGRDVPIQLQVTMETTGRMLVGTEIGAALTALEAMGPTCSGSTARPGPARWASISGISRNTRCYRSRVSPTRGCRRWSRVALTTTSRPRSWRTTTSGSSPSSACPWSVGAAAPRPTTCARLSSAAGTSRRLHASPCTSRARRRSTARCRSTRTRRSSSSASARTPTDRRSSATPCSRRTGTRAYRWPATRSRRARTCSTCASTTSGRDGTADMDEIASRFATQASVPLVLDSTEPQVMEAGLQWIGGRAILNSANLEDGEAPGSRLDRVMTLAREYGAAVICLLIDEEGQARDVEWKLRVAHRIHDLAVNRYGLSAGDLIFDALTFPLSTGGDDLRGDAIATIEGDPPHQGRDARRVHRARRLQRVVRAQAGGAPRAQLGVPARVRRGRARRGDRARGAHHAAQPHRGAPARGRARPRLRPTARRLRPAAGAARGLRGRRRHDDREGGPQRVAGRGAPEAPHHRRRPRRPRAPTSTRRSPLTARWRSSTTCCSPA